MRGGGQGTQWQGYQNPYRQSALCRGIRTYSTLNGKLLLMGFIQNVQSAEYRLSVLPSGSPVMSVEAYSIYGWGSLSHDHFGLKSWGSSGPYAKVYEKVCDTSEHSKALLTTNSLK